MSNIVARLKDKASEADVAGARTVADNYREAAAEIARLREIISGVIVVYNSGALKDFSGEPWLNRVLTTDI